MPILLGPRAESVGLRGEDKYVTISIQTYKIPISVFRITEF